MPLFDDQIESIGARPKHYLEPTFDYYNKTARSDIRNIKTVLERWFEVYPNAGRDDLRARFRSRIERQHSAAFFELFMHEFLRQLGYQIELHPDVGTSTHPDFLVNRGQEPAFLLEVTTTHDSEEDIAAQRRINQVYDTLNRLRSPDFFLSVIDNGIPVTPVPGARLRSDLESWLRQLSWEEVTEAWERDGFDGVPAYEWRYDGWNVVFKPIPKSDAQRGSTATRPIGLTMPTDIRLLATDEAIKTAVKTKDKYGKPRYPLLIAINVLGDFCDKFDVMNSLFGRETVIFGPTGTRPGGRLHDGAWDGPAGPRHKSISSVWIFHGLNEWLVSSPTFWFVHNPWAARRLSPTAFPLSQYVPNPHNGKMEETEGRPFTDIFDVPRPWPPDED